MWLCALVAVLAALAGFAVGNLRVVRLNNRIRRNLYRLTEPEQRALVALLRISKARSALRGE